MCLVVGAGGEVERVGRSCRVAVAELDRPQTVDREGLPCEFQSAPAALYEPFGFWWNAWIRPSPKLPTRRSPLNAPKSDGAIASPHGAFSVAATATRRDERPVGVEGVDEARAPARRPRPRHRRPACAYVTKIVSPMAWIPNGA